MFFQKKKILHIKISFSFSKYFIPLELPSQTRAQEELQSGARNTNLSGLYLWKYNRRIGIAWSLHQWTQRGLDQSVSLHIDWVLPGTLSW